MSVAVELGTNAVRHTASGNGGRFVVEVTWWMQMARIAVYDDGSPDHPRVTGDPLCEDGRGLLMVSALSARMGVGGNEKGRVVRADIPWTGQTMSSQLELPEGLRPQSAMSGRPAERIPPPCAGGRRSRHLIPFTTGIPAPVP